MPPLTLQIPLEVPSPERMEEIFREECRRAAGERAKWLTYEEAGRYIGKDVRTVHRYITKYNVPVSELEGTRVTFLADWDALLLEHSITRGSGKVIDFPSQAEKAAIREQAAQQQGAA